MLHDVWARFTAIALGVDTAIDQSPADARQRAAHWYGMVGLATRLIGAGTNPIYNDDAPLLAAAHICPHVIAPVLAAAPDTESGWNVDADNPSPKATGLAQFIPSTWARYGIDADGKGTAEPRHPDDAIATRAAFMCQLMRLVTTTPRLTGDIADLAPPSSGTGPATVTEFGGIRPAQETIARIQKTTNRVDKKYSAPSTITQVASAEDQAIIQAADKYVTAQTPYAWGGGNLDGPSAGTGPDAGVIGFDCSALTRYAYYQGSGHTITLPRTAQEQYDATKAQPVAVADLRPGDLMFWGADLIYHVALYVGDGKMIEAPESGQLLTVTSIRTTGDYVGAHRVLGGPLDL